MLTKLNLGLCFLLDKGSIITVVTVAWMSLLKLANISFPAKIIFINGVNEQIGLVSGSVSLVKIVPVFGLNIGHKPLFK